MDPKSIVSIQVRRGCDTHRMDCAIVHCESEKGRKIHKDFKPDTYAQSYPRDKVNITEPMLPWLISPNDLDHGRCQTHIGIPSMLKHFLP